MNCPICKEEKWIDMDYLRTKKENFVVCEECGFVTYLKTEKEITDMYKVSDHNAARKFAGSKDEDTKYHKLPYHKKMLSKYKEQMPIEANILDYGCSTGYILNWIEGYHTHAKVEGIELNPAHAQFGREEYGLEIHEIAKLSDLPDKEKRYDLIINFAVLEHIVDPVTALKEMREKLTEDGIIYLMTPLWLDTLYSSDFKIMGFEHLFVPHHINCFTDISRNNCFKLAGLKIVERNDSMYGSMVILKKVKATGDIIKENAKEIQKKISNQRKAIELIFAGNHVQAFQLWKKNPDYYVHLALEEKNDLEKHKKHLLEAIDSYPEHIKLHENLGHFYFQNMENDKAIEKFKEVIDRCPNMYQSYWWLSEVYMLQGDWDFAIQILKELLEVNPTLRHKNFIADGPTVLDRIGFIYTKKV